MSGIRLRAHSVLADLEPVDLALRLSLLTLLLNPGLRWTQRVPVLVLSALALALPALQRSRVLWAGLFALLAIRLLANWPHSDNHDYLTAYWCLAIACSLGARDARDALALNGRLLVGLGFGFALLWKVVLSPDFLDGSFFRAKLLFDTRFADFAWLFGGLGPDIVDANDAFSSGESARFIEPAGLKTLAGVMTVWTIAIEGLVALSFLWPARTGPRGIAALRDGSLLVFCATSYAVAPVAGFGWLLVSMGVAQCPEARWRTRALYVGCFGLVLVYQLVPWMEALALRFAAG